MSRRECDSRAGPVGRDWCDNVGYEIAAQAGHAPPQAVLPLLSQGRSGVVSWRRASPRQRSRRPGAHSAPRRDRALVWTGRVLAVALGYGALAVAGQSLDTTSAGVLPVWPPAGCWLLRRDAEPDRLFADGLGTVRFLVLGCAGAPAVTAMLSVAVTYVVRGPAATSTPGRPAKTRHKLGLTSRVVP